MGAMGRAVRNTQWAVRLTHKRYHCTHAEKYTQSIPNAYPKSYPLNPDWVQLYFILYTTYYMLYAICYMLYAICSMLYATCYMLYAICYMLYGLCSMLYAMCYMLCDMLCHMLMLCHSCPRRSRCRPIAYSIRYALHSRI